MSCVLNASCVLTEVGVRSAARRNRLLAATRPPRVLPRGGEPRPLQAVPGPRPPPAGVAERADGGQPATHVDVLRESRPHEDPKVAASLLPSGVIASPSLSGWLLGHSFPVPRCLCRVSPYSIPRTKHTDMYLMFHRRYQCSRTRSRHCSAERNTLIHIIYVIQPDVSLLLLIMIITIAVHVVQ